MERAIEKKKKTGRPVKKIKKDVRAAVRFTVTDYFFIKAKAASAGIKPAEFIRLAALNQLVKSRLTEEEKLFARNLVGMSNNFNQMVKLCHMEGSLRAMLYFETLRNGLDEVLKKLKP